MTKIAVNNLLKTKLYLPQLRPGAVSRPRLRGRLNQALSHPLTLISAPAGFGKTTLLSEWVGNCGVPFGWLTLDESDNDLIRFATYLLAAMQWSDSGIGQGISSLLGGPDAPDLEVLLTALINDLVDRTGQVLLVLDDYHTIQNPAVHAAMAFLLNHQPAALHLVIITRQDPPLPLPRLRARGQVVDIRADDLRFSVEETARFLEANLETPLDPGAISALQARTEGWAAGLQLAALSLQNSADPAGYIERFHGSQPDVFDFFLDEVMAKQPQEIQDFLRQTAVLDRMNASLCDRLTGRQDSRQILHGLEHANLFLAPLDGEREWYRYYQLFADFLKAGLASEQRTALHAQAAEWFAQQGHTREAVQHFLAAGDPKQAADWIGRASRELIQSGEITILLNWLKALPPEQVRTDSQLAILLAWCLLLTGQYEEGAALVLVIDKTLAASRSEAIPEIRLALGRLRLLQAYLSRTQARNITLPHIREAVELLGDDDPPFSQIAMIMLANDQTLSNPVEATRTFQRTIQIARKQSNLILEVAALTDLMAVMDMQGRRREAAALAGEFLKRNTGAQGFLRLAQGLIQVQAGMMAYTAGELEAAEPLIIEGLASCRKLSLSNSLPMALRSLAMLQAALQEDAKGLEIALENAREAHRQALDIHDDLVAALCAATQADISLKLGRIKDAHQQLDWQEAMPWPPIHPYYAPVYLTRVRLLLAGNQVPGALNHLATLAAWAERLGYIGYLIPIRILQSRAAVARRDIPNARLQMASAIEMAAPQDYRMPFLDAGTVEVELLTALRPTYPAFVDSLLARLAKTRPGSQLIEPLTERELEVLRLMADGLTNQEIAARLVTAISTIKKHVNHIFGKLEAHDRTQAVLRARELGLL